MLTPAKGIVFFFFPDKVGGSFIHSNPKMLCFFFPAKREKKKHTLFFSNFLIFFVFFFFAPVKVHISFIHSIWDLCFFFPVAGKKKTQHFHSFIRLCPKMCKIWTLSGKKKYGTLALTTQFFKEFDDEHLNLTQF